MKHIAYLIPTLDRIGGAEQQVILLAKGLKQRGWKVSVIALSGAGGDAADRLRSVGVGFLSLEMRKGLADPRGWIRFHLYMKQDQPDVVHAHLPHAALLARWSRIGSPICALLDTIHSPASGGRVRRLGYRISAAMPDVVTAVSSTAAQPWVLSGAVNEANLTIIPNGIDLDRFSRDDKVRVAMRRELHLGDEFLWIAVGRLDPVKDHSTLLRAFRMLPENARLIIAGTGPLLSHLASLSDELCLGSRVRLLGFEPDIVRWLRSADGFVLCSHREGLPIALLEACSCELPSIVTDIPGAREALADSLTTVPVPVGDAKALAASMQQLMSLAVSDRHERGQCARNSVAGRFSLDGVLNRWEALYGELLEANPHPRRFGNASLSTGRTFQLQ